MLSGAYKNVCESVFHMYVCDYRKERGRDKSMNDSRAWFKRASPDTPVETLFSVIYHRTCSLGCVCMCVRCTVCDSPGTSRLGINIKQCISLPYAEIGKNSIN